MMKYKKGDKYKNEAFPDRISTIIDVSPKVDYTGGLSYFVMDEENGRIAFSVEYEAQLKEWCEKIDVTSLTSEKNFINENNKYTVNEKYFNIEASDLNFKIISVSPLKDYKDELSYFCEVQDRSGDIWYDVQYEGHMDKAFKKIGE